MNFNIRYQPHDHASDGSGANQRDPAMESLIQRLDALGAAHAHEAAERGISQRVFNASVQQLGSEAPVVAGRLRWQRLAGGLAAAAVIGMATMISLGVFNTGKRGTPHDVMLASDVSSDVSAERMLAGLLDNRAALESVDPAAAEGVPSVAVTRELRATEVHDEIEGLIAIGGAR